MPQQIAELDHAKLADLGLQLTAEQLWNPDDFGLMAAVVNFAGCSSGFVSALGLIATNHHCAYGVIQSHSSVEHDYLTDGFFAPTQADELQAKGRTVKVLEKITDVTERVRAAVDAAGDPAAKQRAYDLAQKTIVAQCEEQAHRSCRVAGFYNGSEVQLHEYLELTDIRLVYAPTSGVGNYGGEVDNWMWPRHSGDYSLLRAYVGPDGNPAPYSEDNVPYKPKRHLQISTEGVSPGDFVAVLGFPGDTDRYLPAAEMRRQAEQFLPARVALYGEWIRILNEEGAKAPAVKIKVAAKLRGLANRHKNARGMLEGIARDKLLQRREAEEIALAEWADAQGETYANVLSGLDALAAERRASFERDFLLQNASQAGNALATALDLVWRAKERSKPDLERKSAYMDRGEERLWSRIEGRLRDDDPNVDRRLMESLFSRVEQLPPALRFSGLRPRDVAPYLAKTKVRDPAFVKELFDAADAAAITASKDPMIALARELVAAAETDDEASDRRAGIMLELGPKYFEMIRAVRKGPVYPDANGTLRFSYGTIKGYAPRDGMVATPQTTLAGQVAKHTGKEPFNLPTRVLEAAPTAGTTRWADPELDDVPVCFLATGDTTGGNSGSPMVDGQGRWIGLNFDRVWENIAGDFGYDMTRSRNIGVDVRYLLWNLDVVDGATRLLQELGISDAPDAKAPKVSAAPTDAKPTVATAAIAEPHATAAGQGVPLGEAPSTPSGDAPQTKSGGGCGCVANPRRRDAPSSLWLLLLLALRRRPQ